MARAGTNFAATSRCASLGLRLRQQAKLQFARQRQIALQSPFLALDLFIQAGVFDGNCNLRGQRGHGALVIFGEESAPRVLQIEHANYFVLVDERNGQLRARFGIGLDVARIFADVGHQHRLLALRPQRPPVRGPAESHA